MKHLIYFLLFSSVVFSQNYNYAIEEPKKATVPAIPSVNNQLEEIEYFKAYLLPITKKATIQVALDTYGSVRLEKGDYSGVNIVIKSNQKLYGHPSISGVSNITIAAGSSNVVLENLSPGPNKGMVINFQAGGVISNCTVKTTKYCDIQATNAIIENNTFIDIIGAIRFDSSASGYFRNNKIIKHQVQSTSNMLVMKGNSATPSYGNVNLHSNYLTSTGITTDISNLQSSTFVGIDCEAYGGLSRELFYAQNIGKMNLATIQGGMMYNSGFGYSNISADNLFSIANFGNSITPSVIAPQTNYLNTFTYLQPTRNVGTVTGFDLHKDISSNAIIYNGLVQSTAISSSTNVSNFILGTKYTPWARPNWETLPDPLGVNWKLNRVGKQDQTAYIQGLINTNGVAELPEGVFYIGSTLNIPLDKAHGIVGQGTGKTVLVGLTDNFPLISLTTGDFGNFTLSNLTLQGGNSGIYASNKAMLWAYQNIKFVVFRDQTYGIQFHQIFGFDNNFFDNVSFVNCTKGIFQDPLIPYVNNVLEGCSYIDKTLFYKSQFINCTTSVSMEPTRANNMNAWVDCKFNGGVQAFNGGGDSTIFANCDFTNYTGSNIIAINNLSLFNSNFYNNSVKTATLYSVLNNFEGCNFLDNSNLFTPDINNNITCNIINSTITGNVLVSSSKPTNAVFVNSKLLSNSTLSKLLVNIKLGVPTILIDATPNPYPQLLVTQ